MYISMSKHLVMKAHREVCVYHSYIFNPCLTCERRVCFMFREKRSLHSELDRLQEVLDVSTRTSGDRHPTMKCVDCHTSLRIFMVVTD
jgi:hypothetical protein